MKIVHVVPLLLSIPPQGYGGIERHTYELARRQRAAGHSVELLGVTIGSVDDLVHRPSSIVHRPSAPSLGDPTADEWQTANLGRLISSHRATLESADIVHNHCVQAQPILHAVDATVVTSVHGDPQSDPGRTTYQVFPEHPYIALSAHQRARGVPGQNWIATVPCGIDLDFYRPADPALREDYFLHMASFCTRKGTLAAIEIARAAGRPIRLVGRSAPDEPGFLEDRILPLVDGNSVIYDGELGDEAKLGLLQRAAALVHPIDWPEPFGLVFIEALACGTPVLTLERGAVPELVRDGSAGIVAKSLAELTEAALDLPPFDPGTCRETVAHLSTEAMADAYEAAYRSVLEGRPFPPS